MLSYCIILLLCFWPFPLQSLDPFLQSECGYQKSCLRWSNCEFPECDFAISWKPVEYNFNKYLQIELVGKLLSPSNGYLALGFSLDNKMMDNGMISCHIDSDNITISPGYNLVHSNFLLNENQVDKNFIVSDSGTIYGAEYLSGSQILRCRFLRLMATNLNSDKLKNLNGGKKYFVLSATGRFANNKLGYHRTNKKPSVFSYDFESTDWINSILTSSFVLIKLHASFMIFGWVFCATNGIILANFYKGNWPEKTVLKGKIWFQFHRIIQSICIIFVSIGFIIVFACVRGYSVLGSVTNSAHPVMGIISTAFLFANPIMALFRCHPDDSKRWIFNLSHFLVGITSYLLAISTIAIGIQLPPAGPNLSNINYPWILVAVYLGLICLIFIYGEIRTCVKKSQISNIRLNYGMTDEVTDVQKKEAGIEILICSVIASFGFGIIFLVLVWIN